MYIRPVTTPRAHVLMDKQTELLFWYRYSSQLMCNKDRMIVNLYTNNTHMQLKAYTHTHTPIHTDAHTHARTHTHE